MSNHKARLSKRNKTMFSQMLMPGATLEKVGKEWGLTRERVRQIIKGDYKKQKIKSTPAQLRKKLFKEAPKCPCKLCGGPVASLIKTRKHSLIVFCSKECRGLYNYFDFTTELKCAECGDKFFPYRNWKSKSLISAKKFCCAVCYIKYMKNKEVQGKGSKVFKKIFKEKK